MGETTTLLSGNQVMYEIEFQHKSDLTPDPVHIVRYISRTWGNRKRIMITDDRNHSPDPQFDSVNKSCTNVYFKKSQTRYMILLNSLGRWE